MSGQLTPYSGGLTRLQLQSVLGVVTDVVTVLLWSFLGRPRTETAALDSRVDALNLKKMNDYEKMRSKSTGSIGCMGKNAASV